MDELVTDPSAGWLRRVASKWLWKLLSAKVAEAVAAQLVQHNKDAEKRELARELLALCIRGQVRASGAIAVSDRLKAAADSAFNRPGAFKAGAHLARLAQINNRTADLHELLEEVEPTARQDARWLQTASADELNARHVAILRTTERIEALATAIDKELDEAADDGVRRQEFVRQRALMLEQQAVDLSRQGKAPDR